MYNVPSAFCCQEATITDKLPLPSWNTLITEHSCNTLLSSEIKCSKIPRTHLGFARSRLKSVRTTPLNLPSRNILRFHTLEAVLAVNSARFTLPFLRHHTIFANIELGAVLWMWIRRMGQNPAKWSWYISIGANKTVVQDVSFHVFAQSTGIGRPDATGHLILVDQTRWTGHYLRHTVDAIDETITSGWVFVLEVSISAWTSFARLWLLWTPKWKQFNKRRQCYTEYYKYEPN